MPEPEVEPPLRIDGPRIDRQADIEAEQTDRRVQPESRAGADLDGLEEVANGCVDIPEIDEADPPDPAIDRKPQLAVSDEEGRASFRVAKDAACAEIVLAVSAYAGGAAGEELFARYQVFIPEGSRQSHPRRRREHDSGAKRGELIDLQVAFQETEIRTEPRSGQLHVGRTEPAAYRVERIVAPVDEGARRQPCEHDRQIEGRAGRAVPAHPVAVAQ